MEQYHILAQNIQSDAVLPTEHGNFRIRVFVDEQGAEHSLLSIGLEKTSKPPLVRIHSECLTGDAFGSLKCDCGPQLQASMARIQEEGCGAILYMRQEGRGIGLEAKNTCLRITRSWIRYARCESCSQFAGRCDENTTSVPLCWKKVGVERTYV